MMKSKARITGFTLIEVLVALGVLAIAMAAITEAINVHVNNAIHIKEQTFAQWVAMNKANEYALMEEWPEIGTKQGSQEMAGHDWHWRATVIKTPDEDMRRIDIEVRFYEDDESPVVILQSYAGKNRPAPVITPDTGVNDSEEENDDNNSPAPPGELPVELDPPS